MTRSPNHSLPWVAIQANPKAGAGPGRQQINAIVDSLRERGFRPLVFTNRSRLSRILENPQYKARLHCIVAAGGDGTAGDVINRYPDCRIAILPAGTENLLARYLGIPQDGRAVAEMIAADHVRTIDLAQVGERRFSLMASIGFDAEVVHQLHSSRKGHISRASYVKPIWQVMRRYAYPPLRVWIDGESTPRSAKLLLVVNLNAYALGIQPATSASENDGLLDLRLFEQGSAFQMLRYFYNVRRGTHESLGDVQSLQASRIRVESDVPVAVQVDGDPAGTTPVEITALPAAGRFFVPGDQTSLKQRADSSIQSA